MKEIKYAGKRIHLVFLVRIEKTIIGLRAASKEVPISTRNILDIIKM